MKTFWPIRFKDTTALLVMHFTVFEGQTYHNNETTDITVSIVTATLTELNENSFKVIFS